MERSNARARARRPIRLALFLTVLLVAGLPAISGAQSAQTGDAGPAGARSATPPGPLAAGSLDDALFKGLAWREVGPYRGGRSAAVTGIPGDPQTYYFGSTGGGVWKTEDGGTSWENVSDGSFGGSIGSVAVSEWDPNVVYVGTGEETVRGNVSQGDGVWKSTDAGRTWAHMGLESSRHIPRIRIHPKNPDLVYAAVMGHLFGPSEERGVYRSKDGGKSWERVLFVNDQAGANDLIMDPTNPRILYACFWRVLRTPWSLESGGEGSGIWKSTDGGDTWTELTGNEGLPGGTWGKCGIAVSPTDPDSVYAIIENEHGGVFRSKDGGKTWAQTNKERTLRQRAWYYTRIYADPADAESLYVVNVRFWRSKDGGKSFSSISVPHGDNHDLWIAPEDAHRMIEANDGGANVSFDGGETWSSEDNQPTAQFYRVSTDNHFPYRLLGGQQDNSAVRIQSRSTHGGSIGVRDWEPTAGGESGFIVAKPDDADVIYGGSYGGVLVRIDHESGEVRAVNVWPDDPMGAGAGDQKYRFQWNYPVFFSPHDPDRLYAAANVLFRSDDAGQSWTKVSPDLTRADPDKLGSSGGPITQDNTSVEYYATIFAAAESPVQEGVLWAGSDDGLVHVSRDDGATWTDVTPDWPEWMQVNAIDPSPLDAATAYVAGTRYKLDDFHPYLYKTTDWGKSWTKIVDGIPEDHFTRVVRADSVRPGLLYAGTEDGVYVSFDDGKSWRSLQLELPIVPITDLLVKEGDLVAATQGRGFWILDDLSPLRALDASAAKLASAKPGDGVPELLPPRPALRVRGGGGWGGGNGGTNPPSGLALYYVLPDEPAADTEVKIDLLDAHGDLIRTLTRKPEKGKKGEKGDGEGGDPDEHEGPGRRDSATGELKILTTDKGMNRVLWDLEYPGAEDFPGLILWNRNLNGPLAVPGHYTARMTVGDWTGEVPFEVVPDPRASATPEDYQAQLDFMLGVRDKLTETHRAIGRIRDVKKQLATVKKRLADRDEAKEVRDAADELTKTLTGIEEALYQTKNESPQDPLNFPIRLNDKLASLLGLADLGDFRPTDQMLAVRDELMAKIDEQLTRLEAVWTDDLPAFNTMARDAGVATVLLPPAKDEEPAEPSDGGPSV